VVVSRLREFAAELRRSIGDAEDRAGLIFAPDDYAGRAAFQVGYLRAEIRAMAEKLDAEAEHEHTEVQP
jgi:hypothetical protein